MRLHPTLLLKKKCLKRERILKISPTHSSFPVLIDKTPMNFQYLGLLAEVFPNAKFIHISRDGKSVSVSVRKKYFGNIYKISSDKNKRVGF